MTPELLASMRTFLRAFRVVLAEGEEWTEALQEQAAVTNTILPSLIDTITDDELATILEEFRSYFLYSIIAGSATLDEEQEGVAPSTSSATSQESV